MDDDVPQSTDVGSDVARVSTLRFGERNRREHADEYPNPKKRNGAFQRIPASAPPINGYAAAPVPSILELIPITAFWRGPS